MLGPAPAAQPRAGAAHLDVRNVLHSFAAGGVSVGIALAELAFGLAGCRANGLLGASHRGAQFVGDARERVARRLRAPRRGGHHQRQNQGLRTHDPTLALATHSRTGDVWP